jgi:xeroderma pigmentosum group C-complementing protein
MTGADEVVQAFHLPKRKHYTPSSVHHAIGSTLPPSISALNTDTITSGYDMEVDDLMVEDLEDSAPDPPTYDTNGVPKSMRELAEASALQEDESSVGNALQAVANVSLSSSRTGTPSSAKQTRSKTRAGKKRARNAQKADLESSESDQPSPSKREKRRQTTVTTTPASSRSLRPRAGKSAAQLQEEKEIEDAYRRAIAQ